MVMGRDAIPAAEHERIASAIRDAESRTSGEIYCVLAKSSDSYFFPAMFTLTVILLVLSLVAALLLRQSWIDVPHVTLIAAQIAAFLCAWILVGLVPALRPHLVPGQLRYSRAHDNAVRQFLSHNIHLTEERTGVLIFVSLAERYAEIVADGGIASRVEQREWDEAVALLVAAARERRIGDGFVGAVEQAGRLLALHFPPGAKNPNEIEDRLAEI
jgi:putative membrane protein